MKKIIRIEINKFFKPKAQLSREQFDKYIKHLNKKDIPKGLL